MSTDRNLFSAAVFDGKIFVVGDKSFQILEKGEENLINEKAVMGRA